MDNTSNIYGIKDITLTADSQVIFHSNLDRFAFDESRYLNSFTDFEEWKEHRSFYIKSFVDPGNRLRFIESLNRGILTIDEPRTYHLTYQLARRFRQHDPAFLSKSKAKNNRSRKSTRKTQNCSIGGATTVSEPKESA